MKESIHISLRIAQLIKQHAASKQTAVPTGLQQWLDESESNKALFERMMNGNDWPEKLERYDELKQKTDWNALQQKRRKARQLVGWFVQPLQVAAVLAVVLLLGGAMGYWFSRPAADTTLAEIQKYSSLKGSISLIELPDSSKIWLNSDSELTYLDDKVNKRRLVNLKGEAYFEVTHRDDYPMEVSAGNLIIRDLGTSFNIKAYPDSPVVETSLIEGKVDILSEKRTAIVELKPGEIARFDENTKRMDVGTFSPGMTSAWKDGKFIIRDQSLESICNGLGHWYGVQFKFENESLREYRYTGIIRQSTSVNQVMKMLKQTTDINYRIQEETNGNEIIIIY